VAAYVVVGLLHNEAGPFDSAAGGAVLSALTLSALALTMGSGYTKYREVMAEEEPGSREPSPPSANHAVSPAVDVHRVAPQECDQCQTRLAGEIDGER